MSTLDSTNVSLDRSGDLTVSLSSSLINAKRHKTEGIPLAPALRPTPTAMVSILKETFRVENFDFIVVVKILNF